MLYFNHIIMNSIPEKISNPIIYTFGKPFDISNMFTL